MVLDWIIMNKEPLKVIYGLLIVFICSIIVLKSDRLFKLSDYQGIRYFRNAFFFYGVAFTIRFILGTKILRDMFYSEILVSILFEFFIITAGLLLFYSLIWKGVEKKKKYNSLFNLNTGIIYIVSLFLSWGDFLLKTNLLMFFSQILLFLGMVFLSYQNYLKRRKINSFVKYHFLSFFLGLIAWILNFLVSFFLNWNKSLQILIYSLNIIFFLLFLYGTNKISGD